MRPNEFVYACIIKLASCQGGKRYASHLESDAKTVTTILYDISEQSLRWNFKFEGANGMGSVILPLKGEN